MDQKQQIQSSKISTQLRHMQTASSHLLRADGHGYQRPAFPKLLPSWRGRNALPSKKTENRADRSKGYDNLTIIKNARF